MWDYMKGASLTSEGLPEPVTSSTTSSVTSSWQDLIAHVQVTSKKVDKMAVFDLEGRPVAVSDDLMVSC